MKKLKLFCFPYAGGSAAVFNSWRRYLHKNIELNAIELAGRGKRIYDPLYGNIHEAVEEIFNRIKDKLNEGPYAFFGHSMGGIIAYELAQKVRHLNVNQPVHLFFSGRGAPHLPSEDEEPYWKLPDDEFKEKILELGGTPKAFFEHPELLEVFLPVLKNDFKIAEKYEPPRKIEPLDGDITVFIGKEEEVKPGQMDGWKDHSGQLCSIHYFPGNHFFIHEETKKLINIINNILINALQSQPSAGVHA
jgi:surfactin synthase thioesterase subunit